MSDVLGYAASLAVLTTFLMRSMVPLRLIAILSNLLFVSYGYLADIHPVLLLHAALLPINIARLVTCGEGQLPIRLNKGLVAPTNARIRQVSLFVLGLTAGSFGLRAFIHLIFVFFSQCRRSFV
jgi:hypothetical protein